MTAPIPLDRPLAFFDLETTGLDVKKDRIVEIAIVMWHPDSETMEWHYRLNPGIPIPKEASDVHGITNEDVADEPHFAERAQTLFDLLSGSDLAGFNLRKYDIPLLQAEFKRAGMSLDMAGRRVIDAQMIFHKEEPRNLANGFRFYTGHVLRDAHSALADTRATAAILKAQIARYNKRIPQDIAGLHAYCDEIEAERGWFRRHESAGAGSPWIFQKGKYKGRMLPAVAADYSGRGYLEWMHRKLDDLSDIDRKIIEEALAR